MSISDFRTQVELLVDSKRNARTWLDCSPVCTKIVDLDFNLQYMSKSGVDALCIEDITTYYDKPYPLQIYPQPYRKHWEKSFQKVKASGEIAKQDVIAISLLGDEIWFDSTFLPVYDNKGKIEYIIVVSIDITERKLADNKLRQLNADLEVRVSQRTLELEDANRRLKEANAQLTILSETDALTKIANRRVYDRRMKESIDIAKRTAKPLSLLMLDIDHFKIYNDKYGHDVGDITLQKVAASIASSLPRKTDLVARFGGEEFVILLPETNSQNALFVAEIIRNNIESLGIMFQGSLVAKSLTVSIGIASLQGDALNAVDLLKRADSSLYQAKNSGRNCSRSFEK